MGMVYLPTWMVDFYGKYASWVMVNCCGLGPGALGFYRGIPIRFTFGDPFGIQTTKPNHWLINLTPRKFDEWIPKNDGICWTYYLRLKKSSRFVRYRNVKISGVYCNCEIPIKTKLCSFSLGVIRPLLSVKDIRHHLSIKKTREMFSLGIQVCPKKGIAPIHSYSFRMGLEPENPIRSGGVWILRVFWNHQKLFLFNHPKTSCF